MFRAVMAVAAGLISSIVCAEDRYWPPKWLEGAWELKSFEATVNGEPPTYEVGTPDWFFFTGSHLFAFTKTKLTDFPDLASTTDNRYSLVLFKRAVASNPRFSGNVSGISWRQRIDIYESSEGQKGGNSPGRRKARSKSESKNSR